MLPSEETVAGLARAFSVSESVVLHRIGEAMGLPVHEPVQVVDATRVPDEELVRELARRLGEVGGHGGDTPAKYRAEGSSADEMDAVADAQARDLDGAQTRRGEKEGTGASRTAQTHH
jgi:hypothetical protein